jgi:hypothetical protein
MENCQMILQFVPLKEFVLHKTIAFVILLDILEHNVNSLVVLERILPIQMFAHLMGNVHLQTIAVATQDTLELIVKMSYVSILHLPTQRFAQEMEIVLLQTIAHAKLGTLVSNAKSSNALGNYPMILVFVLQEEIAVNLTLVFAVLLVILVLNVNLQDVMERMLQILKFVLPKELVSVLTIVHVHLDMQEIIVNSPFVLELFQVIQVFVPVMEVVHLQIFVNVILDSEVKNVKIK